MAGIYIHIPFCKKRCHYCDFYSSANLINKQELINSILREFDIRRNYIDNEPINTIYFGGGTPSLLTIDDFCLIFNKLHSIFQINSNAEVTLEANPDDIVEGYIRQLKTLSFNRISIGTQSFIDEDLQLMNRRHNAEQNIKSIERSVNEGITNISIDLIYGLPGMTAEKWQTNLDVALKLPIKHLSAYHLSIEERTVFHNWLINNKIKEISEDDSWQQFEMLCNASSACGIEQYEISNFAVPGFESKHNSSYWVGQKFFGAGPSAHSFDGVSRQWNVADNNKYIQLINSNSTFYELEELSSVDIHNEFIMTTLRTTRGLDLNEYNKKFGNKALNNLLVKTKQYINNEQIMNDNDCLKLSRRGMFISDLIMSDLFE